ncbi:hypothetical protein [Brevundimonas bullata]|uniref:hypothetical protein n=1 Tax=Brevundimonas bullata TaxID=13160 RepID=UPI003D9A54CA
MTDHSALIERLDEAEASIQSCLDAGDRVPGCLTNELCAEAAAALRDLTEWRDPATAPKEQRIMALVTFDPPHRYFGSERVEIGTIDGVGWCGQGFGGVPTGWLPLPSAPNQAKEAGE